MPAQKMMTEKNIVNGKRVVDDQIKLEVHLTDHCNLNCKGCDHFSPIAHETYLDIEKYKSDLDRINIIVGDNIEHLFLLGGEPLLNKNICEIIEISRLKLKNCPIYILTNGILLKNMSDKFWEVCRKCDIIISITQYPINVDYGYILQKAKEKSVKAQLFKDPSGEKKLYHFKLDLTGNQDNNYNYLHCWRPKYLVLKEGRIYPCIIPAYINHFNREFEYNIPVCDEDSVNIYEINTYEDLKEKLSMSIEFCRYCNIYGETTNLPFELSKRNEQEWL